MTKFEIRQNPSKSISTLCLWVTLENKPAVMVLEGTREHLEIKKNQEMGLSIAYKYWHKQEVEERQMNEIQAKYPKKSVVLDWNEIKVYSKNGSIFKTFPINY